MCEKNQEKAIQPYMAGSRTLEPQIHVRSANLTTLFDEDARSERVVRVMRRRFDEYINVRRRRI